MSKVLKLAGASILALALLAGMAIPTLAAPDSAPSIADFDGEFLTGEVLSIGAQELVIRSGDEELTIAVDDGTLYYRLSMPDRVRAWLQQRLQVRQQNRVELQQELRTRAGNGQGQGQGQQKRVQAAVSVRNQARLQNRLSQMEGAVQTEVICSRWLRNFGEEAVFADISVGDSVVVWLAEDGSLAQGVVIIEPAD